MRAAIELLLPHTADQVSLSQRIMHAIDAGYSNMQTGNAAEAERAFRKAVATDVSVTA